MEWNFKWCSTMYIIGWWKLTLNHEMHSLHFKPYGQDPDPSHKDMYFSYSRYFGYLLQEAAIAECQEPCSSVA